MLHWCLPPVDPHILKKLGSISRSMLWIVVLHKSMSSGIYIMKEGYKSSLKDVHIHLRIHFSFEDTDSSPTSETYTAPHMDLDWVLSSEKDMKTRKHIVE